MEEKKHFLLFEGISFRCIFKAILRNIWVVLAVSLSAVMLVSVVGTFAVKPRYDATMTYSVMARNSAYTVNGNIAGANQVAQVFSELISNKFFKEKLMSADEELKKANVTLSATQIDESNFVTINATADNPQAAYNSLVGLDELRPYLSGYFSNELIIYTVHVPTVSPSPSNTFASRTLYLGVFLAFFVLVTLAIAYFYLRRETVQTLEGARKYIDAPILGVISHEKRKRDIKEIFKRKSKEESEEKKNLQIFAPTTSFRYIEQINEICSQLENQNAHGKKVFLFTGVGESEGKSTISANVATALAMKGKNVALLDCDLRNPSQNLFFDRNYKSTIPLNELLASRLTRENVYGCVQRHDKLGLYMLFAYETDTRCTELLTSNNVPKLLSKLRVMDYIIIDTPPLGFFPDAEAICEWADASILIVRHDYTGAGDINDAIDSLRECKASFLGVVLNDMSSQRVVGTTGIGNNSYYGFYNRYSKHGYGNGKSAESFSKDKTEGE